MPEFDPEVWYDKLESEHYQECEDSDYPFCICAQIEIRDFKVEINRKVKA